MNSNPHLLLTQAQTAIQQGDWSLAIQSLHEVLVGNSGLAGNRSDATDSERLLDEALRLALMVLELGDFQSRWDVAKFFPELGLRSLPPLIAQLHDETAELELRWFAARILGEFAHSDALNALIHTLQTNSNEDLCSIVAVTLANYGNTTAEASFAAEVIAALTNLFVAPQTRRWSVQILSRIQHSDTISLLVQAATDAQAEIRSVAIDALTQFHDPRIPPLLLQALTDPAATVRVAAVTGVGLQAEPSTITVSMADLIEHIQPLLYDINPSVCEQAAIALGRVNTDLAITALAEALRSPHTPQPLQITILQTLGWMESPGAIATVQQFLMQQPADAPLPLLQTSLNALTHVKTLQLKPQISQFLIGLLQAHHPVTNSEIVRQLIALALGYLGESIALESLIQLLADGDVGVQLHAIAALKQLDPQLAHHRLIELSQTLDLKADLSRGLAIALQEW